MRQNLFFYQLEVELLAVEVGADNAYAYRVADSELAVCTAANEAVVGIIEFIVVILQGAHGNHALALVDIDFGIQSPLGNATDDSVVLLAYVLAHELNLLVLDAGTLGIGCYLLLCRTVVAQVFVFGLAHCSRLECQIAVQQTVYKKVGVTAYGRCEM